jgi:hypothetical protein
VGLKNHNDGTLYTIDLSIGTPGQPVTVIIDTGSSDLWVNPVCETSGQPSFCASFPQFDYTSSSTLQDTGAADVLSYGKGNVTLEYVTDVVAIGSAQIKDQVFGVGVESYDIPVGILGLSPPTSSAQTQYSFVLDSMVSQGLIESRAFSLDLRNVDDPNGSVIFGGIDTGKYIGSLEKCPILDPSETPSGADRYWITMTGVGITLPDGESQTSDAIEVPVFLDSGGTLSRLPTAIYQAIGDSFPGAQLDQSSGFYYVDCDVGKQPGSVDFIFNNKKIAVPYADFIWEADEGQCVVGVLPTDDEPVLGDSFLRAAYVVYDQDNRNLHLAQAANCGSNLVEISSGADAVPSVTGDCTGGAEQASATKTFDATRTRAPTNVGSSKVGGATEVGPGPAETRVSVTGGLGTAKPTVGRTTDGVTPTATPSATNNAAAPGISLWAHAIGAVGAVHVVAMAI